MRVVYVALGQHRVRAAAQYSARLAEEGAQVDLVVAHHPEWTGVTIDSGVTVHRVGSAGGRESLPAARRLVLDRGGPLRDADLFVAGDLQAMPVALDAARRRRDLEIRFEPSSDPGRRPAPADLAVVTPWYPSANDPFIGSFVKATNDAVHQSFDRVSILHGQAWTFPHGSPMTPQWIGLATDRLIARSGNVVVEDRPEGELTRVFVPILTQGRDYAAWATAHVDMLRPALPTGRIEAPLIHAHAGIYGGLMAARLARRDARLIVTEHASFLSAIFSNPDSRRLYEEVLQRADLMLAVSPHLRDEIRDEFPHYADKLRVVPNAIDFSDFTMRPTPPRELLRWLYVGRLNQHKGVMLLLDAFARVAKDEPAATLTLVGSGELADAIRRRIDELGLPDRIELLPPVPPREVVALLHRHDLLVHASRGETFGMTVVEAVATGTPVLVARSSGPEETLHGLNGVAGLMFDVSDDPEVIVEGYHDLRRRFPKLDLAAARASMLGRYGREPVAARLMEVYRRPAAGPSAAGSASVGPASVGPASVGPASVGSAAASGGGVPKPRSPQPGRVVVIAIGPSSFARTRDYAEAMIIKGYDVDLLTHDRAVWGRVRLDHRVRVHPLGPAERRNPILRLERLLVYKGPGKILAMTRDLARRWPSLWPEITVVRLQGLHARFARVVDGKIFQRGYQIVRPHLLWRIARRDVLPGLDLSHAQRIVITGSSGVTIGWRLAKRHPDLVVTKSMTAPD